jgi:DNA-directed RNA polymerase subunit E'/Rpb7
MIHCPAPLRPAPPHPAPPRPTPPPLQFVVVLLRDTVCIPPSKFGEDVAPAVTQEIDGLYANKVIPGVGLCICVLDLESVGSASIFPGDGSAHADVVFRMVVFRPAVGEVLAGTVKSSDAVLGVKITLDFFDAITVPPSLLPQESHLCVRTSTGGWGCRGVHVGASRASLPLARTSALLPCHLDRHAPVTLA